MTKVKIGDLVTTIDPAVSPTGDDFGVVLVIGESSRGIEEEVELLFGDGSTDWYPTWMVKVINESR